MQKKIQIWILLACALAVAGCQTAAQRQFQELQSNATRANEAWVACSLGVVNTPEFRPIVRRVAKPPLPGARSALERIGDPDLATPEEIRLIPAFHEAISACWTGLAEGYDKVDQAQSALIRSIQNDSANRWLAIMRRQITWGQANQQADAALTVFLQQTRENDQRAVGRLENMHAAEISNRQAAAAALSAAGASMQRAAIQQQMLNTMNRPVTTNCLRTGNFVNCNTY